MIMCSLLAFAGCGRETELTFRKFSNEIELKGNIIETDLIASSGIIDICDSVIIFSHIGSESGMQLHFYRLTDFSYLTSAGIIGRGPGELLSPAYCTVDTARSVVCLVDVGRRQILSYSLDSIFAGVKTFTTETRFPDERFILLQISPFKDGYFFADNVESGTLLSYFSGDGKIDGKYKIPDFLDLNSSVEMPVNKRMVFFGYSYAFSPDMSRVVIAYKYSDVITICRRDGEILRKITGPDMISQEIGSGLQETYCYMEVKADEDFIYARYKGTTLLDKETMTIPQMPKTLHVFSWEGEPVFRLHTEYDFSSFVVDAERSVLITYSPSEGTFVTYELPQRMLRK